MADLGIGVDLLEVDENGNPRVLWWVLNAPGTTRETVHPRTTAKNQGIGIVFIVDNQQE